MNEFQYIRSRLEVGDIKKIAEMAGCSTRTVYRIVRGIHTGKHATKALKALKAAYALIESRDKLNEKFKKD